MKILLHICCAPCTIFPLKVLRAEGHEIHGFFYNSNIHPYLEYRRRLDTLAAYAGPAGLTYSQAETYDMEEFLQSVVYRENDRCLFCYRIRLERTVQMAVKNHFGAFTTTLLYSRFQKHGLIRSVAENLAHKYGVTFYYRDFREGWAEGIRMSKEMGMYRQPYCGCIYSEKERYLSALLPPESVSDFGQG